MSMKWQLFCIKIKIKSSENKKWMLNHDPSKNFIYLYSILMYSNAHKQASIIKRTLESQILIN